MASKIISLLVSPTLAFGLIQFSYATEVKEQLLVTENRSEPLIDQLLNASSGASHASEAENQTTWDRRVNLESTSNTRDLGGYTTKDGRKVKRGILFRSDSLSTLTEADVSTLQELGLAVVTDFRSDNERAEAPSRLPEQSSELKYQTLAINNPALDVADLGKKVFSGQLSEQELVALTSRESYIYNSEIRREWGNWISSLSDPEGLPHLFHCTAGKDRTGFAAALVLLVLGVQHEQIMDDFLLSNHYLAEKIDLGVERIQSASEKPLKEAVLRDVLGVTATSLEGAIKAMEDRYGSVDAYIEHGLGVDPETRQQLQNLLLE